MVRTLISTIYSGGAVLAAINKLSPERLILLSANEKNKERSKEREASIANVKKNFSKIIQIEVVPTEVYDIPLIVKDCCKIIEKEDKAGNEVSLHISESRKTQALGLLFAGFIKKDKIKGAYYIEEESYKVRTMPLLNFKVSPTKKKILELVDKGVVKVADIISKTGKSKAMVYNHINELKRDGYLSEDMKLTDAGRILVV
ncbi:TPA: CRISPR locus-related DNA-binding protein [Candidatus Woesearchaeota archaeon]|nr:CRISPR locus-related DNA-binding protein [Candidatus Woesearchaeota archaeon]